MRENLLTVDDALARILNSLTPLDTEQTALDDCLGRVLAEEVVAATNIPPFPNSSMDGYAVQSADVQSASVETPVRLHVVGEIVAGSKDLLSFPYIFSIQKL